MSKSIREQLEEAALGVVQEWMPKRWNLDDGAEIYVTWDAPEVVTLEHVETGCVATYALEVKATRIETSPPW